MVDTASPPTTSSDTIACWTCAPLEKYLAKAQGFTEKLGTELNGPFFTLLVSLIGLWGVITGLKIILGGSPRELLKDLLFIILAYALSVGQGGAKVITQVYNASLSIMAGASSVAFKVAGGTSNGKGLSGLAKAAETAIALVVHTAGAIWQKAEFYEVGSYLYAIALVLPFIVLIVIYFTQIAVTIFRLMMLACFAPFLLVCLAFGWGRQMAVAGLKTLIASGLILFASTAALAMAIYGINSLGLAGAKKDPAAFASFDNAEYLAAIAVGWVTIAFMSEATALANSITGSFLSNAAAAVVEGAAKASGMQALKQASRLGGRLGGNFVHNARQAFGQAQVSRAETAENITQRQAELRDRMKNLNKF